jgi:putative endonuclease
MTDRRQQIGRRGEELAARHLADQGYLILRRNWRCPAGEVDIVARQDETLVLVEVRARSGRDFGQPEESITPAKRARLIACGGYLTAEMEWRGPWRIDVVAVELGAGDCVRRITHIPSAVEG